MTETLNNPNREKIQQLLAAIGSRQPDDSRNVEASAYDWHQPRFFSGQQMQKLSAFAARTAALIPGKFGSLCQHSFDVNMTSTSEHFASQFLGEVPAGQTQGPGNYYIPFGLAQDEPCGFVSIPPQTALTWATQLLGDTDSKPNVTRALSEFESSFLFDMASLIITALTEAGEKCGFRPAANAVTNTLPLQLKGTEEFCKITFQVKKSGSETGSEAHILVLCEKLLPLVGDASQAAGKFSPETIARAIQNNVEKISVPITAQLANVAVTVEEILNLTVGDLLLLDKKTDEPAQLIVAGKMVCRGRCAKSAGHYAVVVTETFFETK